MLGTLPDAQFPDKGRMDALSMSPSGKFVLTQHLEGTYVYDVDLTNPRLIFAGAEHSDIAVGADGGDAYVYIDFTGRMRCFLTSFSVSIGAFIRVVLLQWCFLCAPTSVVQTLPRKRTFGV